MGKLEDGGRKENVRLATKVHTSFEICQRNFLIILKFMSQFFRLLCVNGDEFIDAHSSHVSRCIRKCANLHFIALAALPGNHNDSSSCSSGPESPNGPGDNSGRTQYISATCVVVTHYSGDVANVVDEHFSRALNFNDKNSKGEFRA